MGKWLEMAQAKEDRPQPEFFPQGARYRTDKTDTVEKFPPERAKSRTDKADTVGETSIVSVMSVRDPGTLDQKADPEEVEEAVTEYLEERAAIMEHDGGLPREQAEAQAKSAMRVYEYQLTDSPRWLIVIRPGCDLAKAAHSLREKFGEKFVTVRDR